MRRLVWYNLLIAHIYMYIDDVLVPQNAVLAPQNPVNFTGNFTDYPSVKAGGTLLVNY